MNGAALDPAACAAFLIAAFTDSGLCQTAWLASRAARGFGQPLDGGRTVRGRRIFGANKTVRGFVVMVPATAVSFALLATALGGVSGLNGLWPLSPSAYALLGGWCGAGFMAGELPNSFVKRQLDIPPGEAAPGGVLRPIFFAVDRLDSILGQMIALAWAVPVPRATWLYVACAGPVLHGLFSLLLFRFGGKVRPA